LISKKSNIKHLETERVQVSIVFIPEIFGVQKEREAYTLQHALYTPMQDIDKNDLVCTYVHGFQELLGQGHEFLLTAARQNFPKVTTLI
jgi:hypothetical protein